MENFLVNLGGQIPQQPGADAKNSNQSKSEHSEPKAKVAKRDNEYRTFQTEWEAEYFMTP